MQRPLLKWRSLTSLLLTWAFLLLSLSGIILYIAPRCSVALRINWTMLALSKEIWSALHIASALAILIAAAFHLYFNWAAFMNHLRQKAQGTFKLHRELFVSLALILLLFLGVYYAVPPFSTLVEVHESIKDSWGLPQGRQGHGAGHADVHTPPAAASPRETAAPALNERPRQGRGQEGGQGRGQGPGQEGGQGRGQGRGPGEGNARPHPAPPEHYHGQGPDGGTPHAGSPDHQHGAGAGAGQGRGGGQGWGRMSVEALCQREGVSLEAGLARLQAAGISAAKDALLRELAEAHEMRPHDLVEIIKTP